jgi:hypothetical protein
MTETGRRPAARADGGAVDDTSGQDPALRRRAVRTFVRHFLAMFIAMIVGMVALTPVWTFAFDRLGWAPLSGRPALSAIVMATNMAIAMSAWMRFRGHGWAATGEMAAAMYLPFVVLLLPLGAGVLSGHGLMMLGHVLMVPAMIAAMLRRRHEYTSGHAHRSR